MVGIGLAQLALKQTPIDKYLYLSTLRKNNGHLFYRLVMDHLKVRGAKSSPKKYFLSHQLTLEKIKELTPLIYTPVVGEACQRWSEIYQQAEGMFI